MRGASAIQRQRLLEGTKRFVRELQADDGAASPPVGTSADAILCLGLRTELDALSAEILAHALTATGRPARALPLAGWGKTLSEDQTLAQTVQRIHLCTLNATPQTQTRVLCRRLRRHWPNAEIVLVAWCASEALSTTDNVIAMGVDQVAFRMDTLVRSLQPNQADDRTPDQAEHPGHHTPLAAAP